MFINASKWLVALLIAAGLHLLALNLVPDRQPSILMEGGALQVQLGINVSSTSVRVGQENAENIEENPAEAPPEPEPEPQPPEPTPSPTVQDVEPVIQTEPAETFLPAEAEPEPEPEPQLELEPEPPLPEPEIEPEPVEPIRDEPVVETSDIVEEISEQVDNPADAPEIRGIQYAVDEIMQQPGSESADVEATSASSADVESRSQPAQQAGNAVQANFGGAVMQHLSRARKPRASSPGSAYVTFIVALDGSIESVSILTSSGSSRFDREAIRMVERAAPYPVPPPGVNREFNVEIEGD